MKKSLILAFGSPDLDICQKIAVIEGFEVVNDGITYNLIKLPKNRLEAYNPLNNSEQWIDLVTKYRVSLCFVHATVSIVVNGVVLTKNFKTKHEMKRQALRLIIDSKKTI